MMITFPQFLVMWNRRMNLRTPKIHLKIARWLARRWENGDRRLLMMAFRSCGKSTMIGLFAAWLLSRQPGLRILVVAAEHDLATKMVRNIKRIIERHPACAYMKPDGQAWWGSESFTVNRNVEFRDPSVLAKGLTANITGSRADLIIYDDVEVPNTSDTAGKRDDLRERLGEIAYVLAPGGVQLYIGTPHTYYTIYADEPRVEIGEEGVFLDDYDRLKIPLLNGAGESVWPDRYPLTDIERLKRQTGPNKFNSQMMLIPVNITAGRLNVAALKRYDDDLHYSKELRTLFLGQRKLVNASAWWDPAFGSEKGDNSVLAVVFEDEQGLKYIHRVEYIDVDATVDQDVITAQCEQVAQIAKDLMLPRLYVEGNGIGKVIPGLLRSTMARHNVPTVVIEKHSKKAKAMRILEAFDAPLAAGFLHVHRAVYDTPFITEMQEWRPEHSGGYDDGLDAVAGALSVMHNRLDPCAPVARHTWTRPGGKSHTAKTDWTV